MNRKLRDVLVLVAFSLTLLTAIPFVGQVLKGSISGTAVDPQGAVVSNAQVKATHTATGAVLTTKTDSAGLFRFNLIPAGNYKVEISAQGFKTAQENDVTVVAGRDSSLGDIHLAVGGASETVEVTAAAPLIETTQSQITNTFSGTALQTFAGIQENQGLDNLALFVPGVAASRDNNFSNTNGGFGFSVNGLRGRNNDQEIDGQNNNDNSVAGPGLFVSDTEFVQQYVLVTNQFGPEYGRNSGSVVNIITKSGTNNWHGSVYGDENNSVFNSMSTFQRNFATDAAGNPLSHPPRMNSEFAGFTLGGPWIKNKLFVFGGFDEQVVSQLAPAQASNLTPTPAGLATLAGCFPGSAGLAALTTFGPYGVSGGGPTPSGTPTVVNVGTCNNVELNGVSRVLPAGARSFNFPVRVDYQRASDSFTGRYLYNRSTFFDTNAFGTSAAGYPANVPALSQAVLASWTHNFTSRMVNEARVSFSRLNVEFGGNTIGNTVPNASQIDQALAFVSFSDTALLNFGPATNAPQGRIVNTWQVQDNWNYVWGKHTLKAGVNWTYQRSPNIFLPDLNGSFRFGGASAGASFLNMMNDTPNRVILAAGQSQLDFREYDTFLYGGDDWKISQNLTLNLGLTWTYYGQPADLFNQITTARESNPATAFWANTEPLTGGFLNPGAAIPLADRTNPTIPAPKGSFGPSIGFAYSPHWGGFLTGNGKTVIRGGYRYLYDPPVYNIYLNTATSAPMVFLNSLPSPGTKPLPAVPTGPNVRNQYTSFIRKGAFDPRTLNETQITPNFGPDKVHSWSLGIEREVSKNSALELRYVGNHAYNLFQTLNGNPFIADLATDFPKLVPAGETPCPASQAFAPVAVGRINCNAGVQRLRSNSAFSNYSGLQAEYRANNIFKQLTVRAAYTYSKTLDNVSEIFSTFAGGNSVFFAQNPANQVNGPGEYSFSGLDFPHTFSLLAAEQLPFFKEQHGVLGHLLGGWGISGNYIWQSGQRYTPIQGSALAALTANGNYYDFGYLAAFEGVDSARPFLGNLGAPSTAVGAFAGDVCNFFASSAADPSCSLAPNTLISFNSFNTAGTSVTVTKDQVRFILNGAEAQSIFGTPFGNTPRNPVQDAVTNIANLSLFKRIKLGERATFEFHATALNAFNHPNFGSNFPGVDPFLEDAGLQGNATGFGNAKLTDDVPGVISAPVEAGRQILIGGKIIF
ncbi:MAG TPA: carboxypeptidase regulatory-like domain-containing protein [Candidatus Angelobacter sp.]|nr:carboxypeptidase regulatory-like domain-containing protein [Candidatus Angelobacter sp.]